MNRQILLILAIVTLSIAQTCTPTTEQYLDGTTCPFCRDAVPNCRTCEPVTPPVDPPSPPTCTACASRYRLDSTPTPPACQKCNNQGCLLCDDSASECTSCDASLNYNPTATATGSC